MLSVPISYLTPLLITRETNLKYKQALIVTHNELTSIRDMASFQGEKWQFIHYPPPLGLFLPICTVDMKVLHFTGFWGW